jgi:hypothetical protein
MSSVIRHLPCLIGRSVPASSSGGLVFTEGSRHQVPKGHGESLRLPKPVPEQLERHSSLSVIARPNPVGLLLAEATATLLGILVAGF